MIVVYVQLPEDSGRMRLCDWEHVRPRGFTELIAFQLAIVVCVFVHQDLGKRLPPKALGTESHDLHRDEGEKAKNEEQL